MTDSCSSKTLAFNVNHNVFVRLTDRGRKILREQHDELYERIRGEKPPYRPPAEDADGWSCWQLWSLMSKLGGHCIMGLDQPFDTRIRFEVPPDETSGEPGGATLDYTLRIHKPEMSDGMEWVYVNSPDVPGLHTCGSTAERALAQVPAMVARLRQDNSSPENGKVST